jgi:hypothetical protein
VVEVVETIINLAETAAQVVAVVANLVKVQEMPYNEAMVII